MQDTVDQTGGGGRVEWRMADEQSVMMLCTAPHPMSTAEVKATVGDYATAAANAKRAGFDAVEVQGANGFLVEQFLHPRINTRTDHYGDVGQDRAAFLYEVVAAIADAVPGLPVGVKLSPGGVPTKLS